MPESERKLLSSVDSALLALSPVIAADPEASTFDLLLTLVTLIERLGSHPDARVRQLVKSAFSAPPTVYAAPSSQGIAQRGRRVSSDTITNSAVLYTLEQILRLRNPRSALLQLFKRDPTLQSLLERAMRLPQLRSDTANEWFQLLWDKILADYDYQPCLPGSYRRSSTQFLDLSGVCLAQFEKAFQDRIEQSRAKGQPLTEEARAGAAASAANECQSTLRYNIRRAFGRVVGHWRKFPQLQSYESEFASV